MHRPGTELGIYRSQVRRPNHYTTEPPELQLSFFLALTRPRNRCHRHHHRCITNIIFIMSMNNFIRLAVYAAGSQVRSMDPIRSPLYGRSRDIRTVSMFYCQLHPAALVSVVCLVRRVIYCLL